MACYHPIRSYWSKRKNPDTGNRQLVFSPSKALTTDYMTVPCGKCEGCLLDKAFAWSVRCTCESFYHSESYFLTLTYDSEHLPDDHQLNRVHVQQFVKRLRRAFPKDRLRVFYCGEYGERRHRPHYHMIIFGLPLARDNHRLFLHSISRKGYRNYVTSIISKKWPFGLATVGTFTSNSASYVAQYTMKKNKSNFLFNEKIAKLSGVRFVKPFIGMSNRPAIGQRFFYDNYLQIFTKGNFSITMGSETRQIRPLKFFVRQLKKHFPVLYHSYVTRVKRLLQFKNASLLNPKSSDNKLFASSLDKKCRNRYIKEQRTLRRLESRLDL